MSDAILLSERHGPVVTLTLNRPQALNALSPELLAQLCGTFRTLQRDPKVRAVVLTGSGRGFCAGLDLKAMAAHPGGLAAFAIHGDNDVAAAIAAFDRPVIVGVNGVAATGGFELALMGDILLASESARFADTHCRVGLAPGWGLSQKLARVIGPSRACEAHFTGNPISASQAEAWGLVSRVVAPDQLLGECQRVARDIAGCVADTVIVYKHLVNEGLEMPLAAGLVMERRVMSHVNEAVSGADIENRRGSVQQRGREQQ